MSALRDAYELIKDEEHWCQGTAARNRRGDAVAYWQAATRFCASGAAVRCRMNGPQNEALVSAALELFPEIPQVERSMFGPVVWVNDNLGHAEIVQVFEKAIVELEGSL